MSKYETAIQEFRAREKAIVVMLTLFVAGVVLWGIVELAMWDLRTTCAARWDGVGEAHWSRNAQCRVKIDGVFVPEGNVQFNPNTTQ